MSTSQSSKHAPKSLLVLAYVACALIWGTTWYAIRVCIAPGGYPTFESLALRFGIATVVLLPFALRCRPWPVDARTWRWLMLAGVLDAAGYTMVYVGERQLSGGVAAVIYGTQPLVLAFLLVVTRHGKVSRNDLIGALIAISGVGVIFYDRMSVSWAQAIGMMLVFGSVIISTTYLMIMKRHAGATHAVAATTIFVGVTAIVLTCVVFVHGAHALPSPLPLRPTVALIYLAIFGSVIAFAAYFWLLSHASLATSSTLVFVFPIVAVIIDAIWETRMRLAGPAYLGIAFTLAGLGVSLFGRQRSPQLS